MKSTRVAFLLVVFSVGVVLEHLGSLLGEWAGEGLKHAWGDHDEGDDKGATG